jgi:beta-xylosidase
MDTIPPELRTPNYRATELTGIGYDPALERQDPSNVIRVGGTYYAWYTQRPAGVHPYASTIYYATSADGLNWQDRGQALDKGGAGAWDSYGVITPYMAVVDGRNYLFYTATAAVEPFGTHSTLRHIGVAVADSPDGPWQRFGDNPILSPSPDPERFDSLVVDDTHVIVRDGKFWLYFKGRSPTLRPNETKWGLAIADHPAGPYRKFEHNPVLGSGHTVCVWPHREGVAALVDNAGPERFTVQYAADGIHFQRSASLDHVHTGCGPYDPDAFADTRYGRGIRWGVAQQRTNDRMHIVRFDCDLTAPTP